MEKKMRQGEHTHHHHYYGKRDYGGRPKSGKSPGGVIKRTIRGVAAKLGVSHKMVIGGFVLLFVFTSWFALVAFYLAYLWVKSPGKYENIFDNVVGKSRGAFDNMTSKRRKKSSPVIDRSSRRQAYKDRDFSELQRKFDDLEARANNMEAHVSSDEYRLAKEIDDIK